MTILGHTFLWFADTPTSGFTIWPHSFGSNANFNLQFSPLPEKFVNDPFRPDQSIIHQLKIFNFIQKRVLEHVWNVQFSKYPWLINLFTWSARSSRDCSQSTLSTTSVFVYAKEEIKIQCLEATNTELYDSITATSMETLLKIDFAAFQTISRLS